MKKILGFVALIGVLFGAALLPHGPAAQAKPIPAAASNKDYPVFLASGLAGNEYQVKPLRDRLTAEGYKVTSLDLPGSDNAENAAYIAKQVRQTTAKTGKVNLTCFSMSVIACRYALKYLGIDSLVSSVVLYAGGDGNWILCLMGPSFGKDGCTFSPLAMSINLGDDTPGSAPYYQITSFTPVTTPILDGGVCYKYIPPNGSHGGESSDPLYQAAIISALSGVCPGTFQQLPINNQT